MEAYDFLKNMTEAQMQREFLEIYERVKNFRELYDSLSTCNINRRALSLSLVKEDC